MKVTYVDTNQTCTHSNQCSAWRHMHWPSNKAMLRRHPGLKQGFRSKGCRRAHQEILQVHAMAGRPPRRGRKGAGEAVKGYRDVEEERLWHPGRRHVPAWAGNTLITTPTGLHVHNMTMRTP